MQPMTSKTEILKLPLNKSYSLNVLCFPVSESTRSYQESLNALSDAFPR